LYGKIVSVAFVLSWRLRHSAPIFDRLTVP